MKTTFFWVMTIIASAALLVGATVWEGVTDVVSAGDLPGGSFSIATNSFPRNTIVDITNLENGKKVRVKVVSGLETTGLLATLSRTAADSIDLRGNSTCRIRMTQPSDDIAFSHFRLGPIAPPPSPVSELDTPAEDNATVAEASPAAGAALAAGLPVTDNATAANDVIPTRSAAAANNAPVARNSTTARNTPTADNAPPANNATVANNATAANNAAPVENTAADNKAAATKNAAKVNNTPPAKNSGMTNNAIATRSAAATNNAPPVENAPVTNNAITADNAPPAENAPVTNNTITAKEPAVTENPPEPSMAYGTLSLLPTEERPPEDTKRFVIEGGDGAAYIPVPPSEFSPFPAPLIGSLDPEKWYVQVGVYTQPNHVEDEINRIGTTYPLAIQNVGTDTSPIFRILLGPLNQGESGAMLQRFKSIGYADAFVRHN